MRHLAALLALSCQLGVLPLYQSSGHVCLKLRIEGPEENPLPSVRVINLTDSTKSEVVPEESTQEIELEKGDEYLISLCDVPAGWMPSREIWLPAEMTRKDLEETIALNPFEIRIFQHVQEMEVFAGGGVLELRNEQDEAVFEFEPDPQGLVKDENGEQVLLQAGQAYLLVQKEEAPGYQPPADVLIEIPAFMEKPDRPLEFFLPLAETEGYVFEDNGQDSGYWPIHLPAAPLTADEDDFPEEEDGSIETEVQAEAQIPVYSAPAVYVTHTISQPEKKAPAAPSGKNKTGFRVRLSSPDHRYLAGASLAVCDSRGNPIDAWISAEEDHLVAGDKVAEGETYTVKILKPAKGYAEDPVAVEHTAVRITDEEYPLIELTGKPKAAPARTEGTGKIKKTADGLVIAASLTSALAIGLVIFAAMRQGTAK